MLARWQRRFAELRAAAGRPTFALPEELLGALLDEITEMFGAAVLMRIPRSHRVRAFADLAAFPASTLLVVDCFQAGEQVIGGFIVEHASPRGMWDRSTRNRLLGELDAVGRILVHREIHALCTMLFDAQPRAEEIPDDATHIEHQPTRTRTAVPVAARCEFSTAHRN